MKCIGWTEDLPFKLLYQLGADTVKIPYEFSTKSYAEIFPHLVTIANSERKTTLKSCVWDSAFMTMSLRLSVYYTIDASSGKLEIRRTGSEYAHPMANAVVTKCAKHLSLADEQITQLLNDRRVGNLDTANQTATFYYLLSKWEEIVLEPEAKLIIEDAKNYYSEECAAMVQALIQKDFYQEKTQEGLLVAAAAEYVRASKDSEDDQVKQLKAYFQANIPFDKSTNKGTDVAMNAYYSTRTFEMSVNRIGAITAYRAIRAAAEMNRRKLVSVTYVGSGGVLVAKMLNKSFKLGDTTFMLDAKQRVPKRQWFGKGTPVAVSDTEIIPPTNVLLSEIWIPVLKDDEYEIVYVQQFPDGMQKDENVLTAIKMAAGSQRILILNLTVPSYDSVYSFITHANMYDYAVRLFPTFKMLNDHCLMFVGPIGMQGEGDQAIKDRFAIVDINLFNMRKDIVKCSTGHLADIYSQTIQLPNDPKKFDHQAIVLVSEVKEEATELSKRAGNKGATNFADNIAHLLAEQKKRTARDGRAQPPPSTTPPPPPPGPDNNNQPPDQPTVPPGPTSFVPFVISSLKPLGTPSLPPKGASGHGPKHSKQ
jgi:hypothetical protein